MSLIKIFLNLYIRTKPSKYPLVLIHYGIIFPCEIFLVKQHITCEINKHWRNLREIVNIDRGDNCILQ